MNREWIYFWGFTKEKDFFHFAQFSHHNNTYTHCSFNGVFLEGDWKSGQFFFDSPFMSCSPVVDSTTHTHYSFSDSYYETTPLLHGSLNINGREVESTLWCDREGNERDDLEDWEWIGGNIGDKLFFLIYNRPLNPFAKFMTKDAFIPSQFRIEDNLVVMEALQQTYTLEPISPMVIFSPLKGRAYSEQPFDILLRGNKIGVGMRERTYKNRRLN